jgi:hypothetical protein
MGELSVQTVVRQEIPLFRNLSVLLMDEGQDNRLREKAVQN